jgi:hypothetical protein
MCYKNYTISLCSLNLLIFGISILAVSSQCLYDRLTNEHNIYLTCILLAVFSSVMVIISLCTIKKVENHAYALV